MVVVQDAEGISVAFLTLLKNKIVKNKIVKNRICEACNHDELHHKPEGCDYPEIISLGSEYDVFKCNCQAKKFSLKRR